MTGQGYVSVLFVPLIVRRGFVKLDNPLLCTSNSSHMDGYVLDCTVRPLISLELFSWRYCFTQLLNSWNQRESRLWIQPGEAGNGLLREGLLLLVVVDCCRLPPTGEKRNFPKIGQFQTSKGGQPVGSGLFAGFTLIGMCVVLRYRWVRCSALIPSPADAIGCIRTLQKLYSSVPLLASHISTNSNWAMSE